MPRGFFMGHHIAFWNRREIWVGESREDFNQKRDILDSRKIKHAYRQLGWTWYIYVHRKDEEEAEFLIRR